MKYHPHGSVLFTTFSIEEGLLLLSNPLCETILKGCLARAQHLYPVRISHFLVEATHLHLIMTVDNPADVAAFIRHFKTETAHLLNNLLGRQKRTIWCEGYDSPVVLSLRRALMAISYLYANPAKDNLEESIDRYPGLSSWKMFVKGEHTRRWKWIHRPSVRALPRESHGLRGYTKEAEHLLEISKTEHEFRLEPNAWMEAYGVTDPAEQASLNQRLIERVRLLEKRAARKRAKTGRRVMGRERLQQQRLDTHYRPQRSGKRMWCLSENRSLRRHFIHFFRELMAEARRISQKWRLGDFSESYPPGLYPPSMPKLAEPLGLW